MALITTGGKLIRDLESEGALALYVPLEGGFEGRYRRRLRIAGYTTYSLSARGLGDLAAYLLGVHGVRPAHLGKKSSGNDAAVGDIYYIPPVVNYQLENLPPNSKGLVLWIIEGQILSSQEVDFLSRLPSLEPRVKIAIEMGGDRQFSWKPLKNAIAVA
ncbi:MULTISPECIES: NAD(P)H-quinone oxidoreductase subunit N [Arthrospira]|jgi:NAD(P)H-quinone oxidoreductase subunit N|uniref:NAD(P)H-quinone oxidoreductase subunit N n=1 Tax=Limnospira platensis NIES-46 TaxID=1236695 RepID=A0A5M3T762_LIMPL|nr:MULTISPECIES: NAD(P)H-quinone oxidoreductase subunit N [Arthrospira]AMW28883.1 NAD(P)H-quinone oxidoreductase [Arthrospira platensis YZ]KDR56002.1 NAD(P)H-quinone oxidoreductase [Arthrospira platensis str. Paraca]MBD2669786.1 NAD(P)H-quinone oxidoreductase subunit N [Arthrospira platensis FACHB-439]MBD2710353.1 NAD(P)H-quinone oxidoreductase subunit N [Arthrospira platensis FACHB-835]MDF2212635.1 NAD(P)H-quinone oxidoreductase subunit N [Arthrospira platensis NCB002]MDT9183012.1 NAD(P)H-qu